MPDERRSRAAFDDLVTDVSSHFDAPSDIVDDPALSRDQKIALLQQWGYDLELLLIATEENMPGDGTGAPAERLRQVHAALDRFGAKLEG